MSILNIYFFCLILIRYLVGNFVVFEIFLKKIFKKMKIKINYLIKINFQKNFLRAFL
ncbi:unnamed protein product [Meloidogyne enterolobii]|uniref:Uncharacterized protein n=1 Tax=Meloidogyne enterolobii TaxID=390850 RepID=A0ACB0Y0R9_MELEN